MTGSPIAPRSEIARTPPDQHGALDHVELGCLGLKPGEIIDFSANGNPFGPSPRVQEAIAEVPLSRYPDRDCLALRRTLSECYSVPIEQIVCGNGVAELLWLLAFAFVGRGDRVLVVGPTFGEYKRSTALAGARVEEVRAGPERDFIVDTAAVEDRLQRASMRLVFICNPNNPTGALLSPEIILRWMSNHPATLFIVDEAYEQFCPELPSMMNESAQNLLILRSMTKDYGLAGLRLGYATGPREAIEALARVRPPWNVNAVAQAAGVAALQDGSYLQMTMDRLQVACFNLIDGLRTLGMEPVPSRLHYFIANVGKAADFRMRLLQRRIQVRDCASFGLPAYIRIATRRPEENGQLLKAVSEVLHES